MGEAIGGAMTIREAIASALYFTAFALAIPSMILAGLAQLVDQTHDWR